MKHPAETVVLARTTWVWLVASFGLGAACRGPSRSRMDAAGGAGGQGGGADGADVGQPEAASPKCGGPATTFGSLTSPWKPPVVQCRWEAPERRGVYITPLVIDLDRDGKPEIVFSSLDDNHARPQLHALRGDDCAALWSVDAPVHGEMAVGDLDGDGAPEIVGYAPSSRVVTVFGADGTVLASSAPLPLTTPSWIAPAIANLDGSGFAEIMASSTALRYAPPTLEVIWAAPEPPTGEPRPLHAPTLVADLDLDGTPDVFTCFNHLVDGPSGKEKSPAGLAMLPHHSYYFAAADLHAGTPGPELALVSPLGATYEMRFLNPLTGTTTFGPYTASQGGGSPVVGDFDGDGRPEVGIAGGDAYRVYDPDCAPTPLPAGCQAPGVLWASASEHVASWGTSSTAFDFNNDCVPEVVYRDSCWLRIYDGRDGKVLSAFSATRTGGDLIDEAVVADVDGDDHAEIVISTDRAYHCSGEPEAHTGAPWTGATAGIVVLRDPDDRWIGARKIWNQNTYHVTNVDEDGRVPGKEVNSWDAHNTYRQNLRP